MGWNRDLHHHLFWSDEANSTGFSVWASSLQIVIAHSLKHIPSQNMLRGFLTGPIAELYVKSHGNYPFHQQNIQLSWVSRFSLKLGNSGRLEVPMPEKRGCLMRIMTRAGQRILSNPVQFLEQNCLHLAPVEDLRLPVWSSQRKSAGSPQRETGTVLGRDPDHQYRVEQNTMELHKAEISIFHYNFSAHSATFVTPI